MDRYEKVISHYNSILALQTNQIEMNVDLDQDDSIEYFFNLGNQVTEHIAQIQELENERSDDYTEEQKAILAEVVATLLANNKVIQTKLELTYNDASITMRQVSRHRKTLTSYGGVQQYDEIAYYFDEKR